MKTALRTHVAAALLLLPMSAVLVAEPAAAQQRAVVSQPGIRSMALNSTAGLAPGATLRVQLYASPNARNASLVLGNSGVRVALREQSPGNYVGSHVIRRADRIDPLQIMTARATYRGDYNVSQAFSFPPAFQALAMGGPARAVAPEIERFAVQPRGRLVAGRELRFRLVGEPRANASVDIPGVVDNIRLRETRPGVYEGTYTVRRRDNLDAFDRAVATLREGNRKTVARVEFRDNDRGANRDQRPPQVSDLTPSHGERVEDRRRTRITARISDDRSGIDTDSVRLSVDGRNVTRNTEVTDKRIRYRDELDRGNHTAELVVRDKAGNVTRTAWSFWVV